MIKSSDHTSYGTFEGISSHSYHRIEEDETNLVTIAIKFGVDSAELRSLNRDKINLDELKEGDLILIPRPDVSTPPTPNPLLRLEEEEKKGVSQGMGVVVETGGEEEGRGRVNHVVEEGEELEEIAEKYGVEVAEIRQFNRSIFPSGEKIILRGGMILKIFPR